MTESPGLIWRYYAFRTTNSAGFFAPVTVVYLGDQGFSLSFVLFSYAVYSFAAVAVEIPTGYLGDRLGRRGGLALASVLRAATLGGYAFVDSASAYLALHVLWATGRSFRSGTQDAWLYELLKVRFDESEYARIEGRGSTDLLATSAVTAVAGGVLYGVDATFPFLANATLALVGVPILFTFPAVEPDATDGARFTVGEAVRMLRLQASRPAVRWLVAYAALFQGLFSVTRIVEQPSLEAVGLPVAGLGVLYAEFKLVSAGAASTAGWFDDRLGTRGVFALLAPVYGLAYAGIALVPVLVIPALFLNRGLRVVARPVRNQYLNDRLGDVGRATVLSGASMVLSLASGVARLVVEPVAAWTGPVQLLPWAGIAVAGAAGVLWLATSPVRPVGETVAANAETPAPTD